MSKSKIALILMVILIANAGILAGYFYFMYGANEGAPAPKSIVGEKEEAKVIEDATTVKVYYPQGHELQLTEIKIKRTFDTITIIETAVNEFFNYKGVAKNDAVPKNTKLLGLYYGIDKMLYVDLSQEFTLNFHGDALNELMVLKALYETVSANVDVEDVKIVINGKEVESMGGHYYLRFPLKRLVSQEVRIEEKS